MSSVDLAAERVRLEAEIASLEARLREAEAKLARFQSGGARPRGLWPGILAGTVLAVVSGALAFYWMLSIVLSHD